MDPPPIKTGHLYRPQKGIKKYWVKRWALLYPACELSPPRLETFESKDASYKEGTKPTVLSLPTPVRAIPTTLHRSRDFVIEIKIDEKNVAFAVDTKEELDSWLYTFAEISGVRSGRKESLLADSPSFAGEAAEGVQENTLYDAFENMTYPVSIKSNPFSESLGLHGYFSLQIDSVKLSLTDGDTNNILYAWPYRYLRRYGRDKISFSMEAGRKCDSGPGLLVFETKDGNDIFHNIQNFVNSISGRQVMPPAHPRQQEQQHIQAGKDGLAWKASQSKPPRTKAQTPQQLPRAHPTDPIGAIEESSIFKQKQATLNTTKDEPRAKDLNTRRPKPFQGKKAKLPRSPSPLLKPDPLYSEVQEDTRSKSDNPVQEWEYSTLQDSELDSRLPPCLPESSEYDLPDPPPSPKNMYDITMEEGRTDSWKIFGRTEDNIHTEHYMSGVSILEEESSVDSKPSTPPVKPSILKPKPQIRQKHNKKMSKTESPEPQKETVSNTPSETLYDTCGSVSEATVSPSLPEGDDVYDHFTRTTIAQPVPAPRKNNPNQQSQQVDDETELYDHLQRETNVGGPRMAPQQSKPYMPQQRSTEVEDTYDSLVPEVGSMMNPMLPEESQYSEANANPSFGANPKTTTDSGEPEFDENPYDVVSFE